MFSLKHMINFVLQLFGVCKHLDCMVLVYLHLEREREREKELQKVPDSSHPAYYMYINDMAV